MIKLEKKIKQILLTKKIKVKDFCFDIEMSKQNLYNIYERNSAESKYLIKMSEVLQVPVSYFFEEEGVSSVNNSGNYIGGGKNNKIKQNQNADERIKDMEIENLKKEIANLKESHKRDIENKNELISVLKELK